MRIVLVSSEVAPFAKTGGLADVTAALARHLAAKGEEVRVLMPMYRGVRESWLAPRPIAELQDVPVELGWRRESFSVSAAALPASDVDVWLVRSPPLYDRDAIYTGDPDEHVRFALLAHAAALSCQWTQWAPDVVHCNDWHAGLLPLLLKSRYAWDRLFAGARSVLSIHNLGYQGSFPAGVVDELGLANERRLLHQDDLRAGVVNFLKTGILYADAITTVSETYAREIQGEEHGMGLHELLRARADALAGIVNGVDYDVWDPARDPALPYTYSADDLEGKALDKRVLLEEVGLPPIDGDPGAPVFGIVSRLTAQKGFELFPDVLPALLRRTGARLVALGSGERDHESFFAWLQESFPGQVAFHARFDDGLAHRIEAGADLFLMPSRYEPCGLNQMYSLRYGTVPIVRRTGGLADTVEEWDPVARTGTGFRFDEFRSEALAGAIDRALAAWEDRDGWEILVRNGMERDFSWERQVDRYLELYRRLGEGAPVR